MDTPEKYCPICGKPGRAEYNRFGEWACSDAHAEEFAKEMRDKRHGPAHPAAEEPRPAEEPPRGFWRRRGGC